MLKELALIIPNHGKIEAPGGIPSSSGLSVLTLGYNGIINIVFVISIVIALFFLAWAGIQWTMSGGDKAKIQAARMRITYSLLGLVLLFLSFFIINLVGYFFNVELL